MEKQKTEADYSFCPYKTPIGALIVGVMQVYRGYFNSVTYDTGDP